MGGRNKQIIMTITEFITKALRYGGVAVENANDDLAQAIEWINSALVNRHSEVCNLMNKWDETTGTVDSNGYTITLPTNWDWLAPIEVFTDSNYLYDLDYDIINGKIKLETQYGSGRTIYIRYRKAPTVYTAVSETLAEADNPRLGKIIMDEFLALFLATDNDLEANSAESQQISKANNNS